jgi:hypothetical protein
MTLPHPRFPVVSGNEKRRFSAIIIRDYVRVDSEKPFWAKVI